MTSPERRVALVTGSATGIGRACAERFAGRGLNVVVNYSRSEADARETVARIEAAGVDSLLVQADVGREDQVRRLIDETLARFGRLDVLVNNAATTYFIDHKDLEELTEEKWDDILRTNVKGVYFCMRAAIRAMQKQGGGAIVSVSSVAGITGDGSSIAYAASKAAVNSMTRSLARAFGPEIRVNAVCPGPTDTRWLRKMMTEDEMKRRAGSYPMRRAATPEDIADAVEYLALGTTLTTGQCLVVDGGRTMF